MAAAVHAINQCMQTLQQSATHALKSSGLTFTTTTHSTVAVLGSGWPAAARGGRTSTGLTDASSCCVWPARRRVDCGCAVAGASKVALHCWLIGSGTHASMRVPPQLEEIRPIGVVPFRASYRLRPNSQHCA